MWSIDKYDIRSNQLDFSSSSGGRPRAKSVYVDDIQLVNAADFADLSTDPTQVHVCEECGVVGCADGGYVRLRRIGHFCIWLPDFPSMLASGWESRQYAPPSYVEHRGIPMINRDVYARLASELGQFPPFDELLPLLSADTARIVQWDAPLNILGTFAVHPTLMREYVLAVSAGDTEQECNALQECLDRYTDHEDSALDLAPGGEPVEFHLDGPRFPSWTPMKKHDRFRSLQLDDQLAVRLLE